MDKERMLEIIIVEPSEDGNIGVLLIDFRAFCWTMFRDYQDEGYAIRPGIYKYKRVKSPTYGETFEILVEGHTSLLFHKLNFEAQSKGCIGLGQYPGEIDGKRAILNSDSTMKKFMGEMEGVNAGTIRIWRAI